MDYKTKIKGMFKYYWGSLPQAVQYSYGIRYDGNYGKYYDGLQLISNNVNKNHRPKFIDKEDMCNSFILEMFEDKNFRAKIHYDVNIAPYINLLDIKDKPHGCIGGLIEDFGHLIDYKVLKIDDVYLCKTYYNGSILDVSSHSDKKHAILISLLKSLNGLNNRNLLK